MDFGVIGGIDAPDPAFAAARYAMGDTRRFAERVNLLDMTPRGDPSSTGYALANPGREYLILQPTDTGDPFTVELEPGTYSVEWLSINARETIAGDDGRGRDHGELSDADHGIGPDGPVPSASHDR